MEFMDRTTKEFEPMQVQFTITPELRSGYGGIYAVNRMNDDEAQERAAGTRSHMVEVHKGVGCGCIDGRCVLHTLDKEESLVGPKTAGGIAITTLGAMELAGAFESGSVYSHFAHVIDILEDDGDTPVRFHIDADHEDEVERTIVAARKKLDGTTSMDDIINKLLQLDVPSGTGCGMDDQLAPAFSNMARVERTYKDENGVEQIETQAKVEARLEYMRSIAGAIKDSVFSEEIFEQHVAQATKLVESNHFSQWDSMRALILADVVLQNRGVKNGVFSRLEVLETSEAGVHGHVEDLICVNKRRDTTLDQNAYFHETGFMVFWFDEWLSEDVAETATSNEAIQRSVSQGVTSINVAGAFQLTDGTQRAVIYT